MLTKKAASAGQIVLTRLQEDVVEVEIEGVTPVIPHKWSEKALKMMPGHPEKTQMREQKGPKDPKEEAESYLYRLPDGRTGIKATAFKAAMAGGARLFDGLTMTEAKVWQGVARHGRHGKTRHGLARLDWARHGRCGWTRLG